MAAISGQGGSVYFTPEAGTVEDTIDVAVWELESIVTKAEVSPSGSGAGMRYLPENITHQWKLTTPLDDEQFPDVIGITEGVTLSSIYFKLGVAVTSTTLALYDKLTNSMVENVQIITDTNNAIQLSISGCGGSITRGVTA